MGRRILVTSNCQTGGLFTTLSAMLPGDSLNQIAWLGAEPAGLRELLSDTDIWVCSVPRDQAQAMLHAVGSRAELMIIPAVWFTGFHPDLTPIPLRSGGELGGAVGPYHSKIVLWAWSHGMDVSQTIAQFRPETFSGLGYLDSWQPAVDTLRSIFAATDFDIADWLLPLSRRGVFMLTNNHPRIDAIIHTARLVAARLSAVPELLRYEWELVVPDGLLATSVVWPIYPGISDVLDLPGAYMWRLGSGELIGLEQFVTRSFQSYESLDLTTVDTAHIDLDPRFSDTLVRNGRA